MGSIPQSHGHRCRTPQRLATDVPQNPVHPLDRRLLPQRPDAYGSNASNASNTSKKETCNIYSVRTKYNQYFAIHNSQFIPSHHPLFTKYTFILDLTKSEDELLARLHPKTRYNIKVAQKHNVKITEDNSPAAFKAYLRLTEETTSRQGFFAHNKNYHKTMWEIMRAEGIAHLFTASYEGEVLSAWIVFVWGDTIYYPYGSSSRNHREVMAPTLLLWEIAKWAKQKGLKHFDLWGAMGPSPTGEPDPKDPWYGFHRFKQGFSPRLVEFAGSFDLVIKPVLYSLYTLADTIRWKLLKWKR